jgi:serpin B
MHRSGAFNYAETAEFQAVALPYKDERFELIVALPTGRDLRPDWYGAVQAAAFSWRPGEVDLPRLQLKASEEMLPALKAAGLSKALSGGADYSGLSAKPPRIDSVAHSAVLVVDEEGAEGAAATAIVGVRSAVVLAPFKFRADRPFELALRDRLSGALLFLGHVSEPGVGP